MKNNPAIHIWAIFLSGVLATSSAWAASGSCNYAASGTGMGGTGISGTGMGGTGMLARGTGMGGTGMKAGSELAELKVAGSIISSSGPVAAQSNGRTRLLAKGDSVCVGETIVTQQSGMAQIRMMDDGLIAIRPQTELKIEKFAFNGTEQDVSLISLFKGASRFVTGKLGKLHPQFDLIQTPNATIGVRGTDHVATVILPGNSAGYPAGTYDKVNQGITFIRTEKGEIDIHPNQVGLAESMNEVPALLNAIPEFYKDDSSLNEKGEQSETERSGAGAADGKMEGSSREQAGKEGGEIPHPAGPESSSGETHGNAPEIESPESPSVPDTEETPSIQEVPEIPSVPELPESSDS